jgi:outer membrane protein TolC
MVPSVSGLFAVADLSLDRSNQESKMKVGKALVLHFFLAAMTLCWAPQAASMDRSPTRPSANDAGGWQLKLQDFLELVHQRNERILIQDAERVIKEQGILSAEAAFEPALVADYQYDDVRQQNTVRELVSLGFEPLFYEQSNTYDVGVESLVPTGARVKLGYNVREFENNIDDKYNVPQEYKNFLGASITQPLLKNAGIQVNKAAIQVAEKDSAIAFQEYREQMMRVLAEASQSYWELRLAQDRQSVRENSVRIAEDILQDNIVRVRTGKMAETEILEAKSGLSLRKSLLIEARYAVAAARNSARGLFSSSKGEGPALISAADSMSLEPVQPDLQTSLDRAYKLRAEYLSGLHKLEKESIRVMYAQNQRYPQIDLKGSYGLNGLATDYADSLDQMWDTEYAAWSVGVELRVPLSGDKKSRSELNAAQKRKEQALLELKSIEIALYNGVDTAIQQVVSAAEQARHYADAVEFNEQLLNVEIARLEAGKSNSRMVLEKEEDLLRARESTLESLVNFKRALINLHLAEGYLLLSMGYEVMEVDL